MFNWVTYFLGVGMGGDDEVRLKHLEITSENKTPVV